MRAVADRAKTPVAQRVSFVAVERASGRSLAVALADDSLQRLAVSSGFSPSVPLLLKMIFSALAGASPTTTFGVLTRDDDGALWQRHADPQLGDAPGTLLLLQFQLRGDFGGPADAALAAFCVPLRESAAAMQHDAVMVAHGAAAAATAAATSASAGVAHAPFTAPPPVYGDAFGAPRASAQPPQVPPQPPLAGDAAALTQLLHETQRFLHQQRDDTVQRMERINADMRARAAECASLRRDVDILKSQMRHAAGGANAAARPTSTSQRFPSPFATGRPGSASSSHARSPVPYARNGSAGNGTGTPRGTMASQYGGGGGARAPALSRAQQQPPTQQRRFDSPISRAGGGPLASPGSSASRRGLLSTPDKGPGARVPRPHGSGVGGGGNDGSRSSVGSTRSDRMHH